MEIMHAAGYGISWSVVTFARSSRTLNRQVDTSFGCVGLVICGDAQSDLELGDDDCNAHATAYVLAHSLVICT